jgi:hypothetical protein
VLTCAPLEMRGQTGQGLLPSCVGGLLVARYSPENVKDSGRMPMPNDVRPSKLENIRRTISVYMVLQ